MYDWHIVSNYVKVRGPLVREMNIKGGQAVWNIVNKSQCYPVEENIITMYNIPAQHPLILNLLVDIGQACKESLVLLDLRRTRLSFRYLLLQNV